jgi:hypothetical protein
MDATFVGISSATLLGGYSFAEEYLMYIAFQ